MEPGVQLRRIHLERGSNSGQLDQQASASPTELPGLFGKEAREFIRAGVLIRINTVTISCSCLLQVKQK